MKSPIRWRPRSPGSPPDVLVMLVKYAAQSGIAWYDFTYNLGRIEITISDPIRLQYLSNWYKIISCCWDWRLDVEFAQKLTLRIKVRDPAAFASLADISAIMAQAGIRLRRNVTQRINEDESWWDSATESDDDDHQF